MGTESKAESNEATNDLIDRISSLLERGDVILDCSQNLFQRCMSIEKSLGKVIYIECMYDFGSQLAAFST